MIFFRILIIISYNVFFSEWWFSVSNNYMGAICTKCYGKEKENECWLSMRNYFRNQSKNWKNVWNQRLYLRSIGCWNSFLFFFFSRNSVCQKFNPHFIHLYHLPFLFFSISLILRSYFYLIFFGFTCYYILFIYSKPSLLVYKETTYVATWSMKNLLGNSVLSVTVYKKKISDQLR